MTRQSDRTRRFRQVAVWRAWLGFGLLLTALPAATASDMGAAGSFRRAMPVRVAGDPALENNQALQFMQADTEGRVFLLHGDNLQIDQILPSGKTVVAHAAAPAGGAAAADWVADAAMSPDGGAWLLECAPDGHLSLLQGDERRQVPAVGWMVSALTYTRSGPVVAVVPARDTQRNAAAPSNFKDPAWDAPPLLMQYDDQGWRTLVTQSPRRFEQGKSTDVPSPGSFLKTKAERDTRLAAGRDGAIWVGQQNAYALKMYSAAGIAKESVTVGGGQVRWAERSEDEWQAMEKRAQAEGIKLDRAAVGASQAVRVVRGMTAQGNRVYLVVETSQGLAVDCWDHTTQQLNRVLLGEIPSGMRYLSVAAGRSGLYLAGRGLGEPVWEISWDQLDERWKPVPQVKTEAGALVDTEGRSAP